MPETIGTLILTALAADTTGVIAGVSVTSIIGTISLAESSTPLSKLMTSTALHPVLSKRKHASVLPPSWRTDPMRART